MKVRPIIKLPRDVKSWLGSVLGLYLRLRRNYPAVNKADKEECTLGMGTCAGRGG